MTRVPRPMYLLKCETLVSSEYSGRTTPQEVCVTTVPKVQGTIQF